ncbi:hypothetical protein [Spirosoma areae]
MAITPQKIPVQNIIRKVAEVVDFNADLLIVSGEATDAGFSLATESGETVEVDLSEKFVTRQEYVDGTDVPPASELDSGRIKIADQPTAEAGEDDTEAMTPLKTGQLLLKRGIPLFDLTDAENGQALIIEITNEGLLIKPGNAPGGTAATLLALYTAAPSPDQITFIAALLTKIAATPALKTQFCAIVSSCTVVTPPDPVPVFTGGTHYQAAPVTPPVESIDVVADAADFTPIVPPADSIDVVADAADFTPIVPPADSIDVVADAADFAPIAPTITDYRIDVAPSPNIPEGGEATAKVMIEYSSGPDEQYTGGGSFGLPIPLTGVDVTNEPNAECTITVGDDVVNADTELVLRFTFPAEGSSGIIGKTLTILNGAATVTGHTLPDLDVTEGEDSVEIQVKTQFSSGPDQQYTGAGDYSLIAPYPDDMTLTPGPNATAVAHVAEGSITANVPVTYRFTFPDNSVIEGIITAVNVASPPALIIESILREVRNSNIMFYVRTSPETFATGNFTSIYYRRTITDEEGTTGYNAWGELYTLGPNGTDPAAFIFDPDAYDDGYHHLSYGQYYQESGAAFSFSIEFSLSADGSNAIHLDYEMPAMASNPVDTGTIVYNAPTP